MASLVVCKIMFLVSSLSKINLLSVITKMNLFLGPRSRQTSVEVDQHPISHEEVYKNLRKTTAEIQNYSFESKLDRDANSKDSGISQMGDHLLHAPANGFNGHAG
jgi:hypothetical protein